MVSTILITGANRGLGLGLASLYADDGWQVIGCCRDPASATELQALVARSSGRVRVERLDVENLADIDALAQRLDGLPLDILCNVAGYYGGKIFSDPGGLYPFGSTDYAEWERVFRINVMGPMRMAEALIENVAASGQRKIVSLSSITGSIGANVDGYMYGYRSSKSALNSIMKSMAIELADRGVIAVPLHPGSVRTDMGGPSSDIDVIESVTKMKRVIDALTLEQSGTFLVYDGSTLPW